MPAAKYNLSIDRYGSFTQPFQYLTSDGSPFNLNGYSIRSMIRPDYLSPSASAEFTCSIIAATSGSFTLNLHPSSSAALTGSCYYYDVRMSSGSAVLYAIEGKVTVSPAITR